MSSLSILIFKRLIPVFLLLTAIFGCTNIPKSKEVRSANDLHEARVGVLMGSTHSTYVNEQYPKATLTRYASYADAFSSLQNDLVDVVLVDEHISHNIPDLKLLGSLFEEHLSIGFKQKHHDLHQQFNHFLHACNDNGMLDAIKQKWIENPETSAMPSLDTKPAGTPLKVGCIGSVMPYDFIRDGRHCGIAIELFEHFARSIDRPVEYHPIAFNGLLTALYGNKIDVIVTALTITPDRKKQILMSEPYMSSKAQIVVKEKNKGIFSSN